MREILGGLIQNATKLADVSKYAIVDELPLLTTTGSDCGD